MEQKTIFLGPTWLFLDINVTNDLVIRDFEIIDRMVFFCGNDLTLSGFIGWFDIDSLFWGTGHVHIDPTLNAFGLNTLENIELYRDEPGNICIAGYGKNIDPITSVISYLAFEAVGLPSTGIQYRTLALTSTSMYDEIVDMAVTDNYVVYLNHSKVWQCFLYGIGVDLQPFPKYGMFASSPFPYYFFQTVPFSIPGYVTPDCDDPYYLASPKVAYSSNDAVTVCSYRRDFDYSGWTPPTLSNPCGSPVHPNWGNTYLAFRTYDLSPMLAGNPIQMTSATITQFPYPGNASSIVDFEYDPYSQHYIALHQHETSASLYEHGITTVDYSMGIPPTVVDSYYQTTYNTSSYWWPQCLCIAGPSTYTVSGNALVSYYEHMIWSNTIPTTVGNCDRTVRTNMTAIPTIISKPQYNDALPTIWKLLDFNVIEPKERVEADCEALCY